MPPSLLAATADPTAAVVGTGSSTGCDHESAVRPGKLLRYLRASVRFSLFLVNNLYIFPTYGLWMVTLQPLTYVLPSLYWLIEGYLFKNLCLVMATWTWLTGYRCYEVGQDMTPGFSQESLVIANHQSTADVPMFMTAFQSCGNVLNRVMWVMEHILKFTNFGLVSAFRGDFFVLSGKASREDEMEQFREHLRTVFPERSRQWIVLFPEGGFFHKRRERNKIFAEKNNLPVLGHICLPRVGAFHTIIEALHPRNVSSLLANTVSRRSAACLKPLKWVVDVTIGYPKGDPTDIPAIIGKLREPCDVMLYYRRFPIEEIPTDLDGATKWLYQCFVEKDSLLEEFYRTGSFPRALDSPHTKALDSPRLVEFNNWWLAWIHFLYIMSTYFHYRLLRWVFRFFFPV